MRARTGLAIAGGLLAVLTIYTVADIVDGPELPDPAPAPTTPGMPDGFRLTQVPRGGALYDCVVHYQGTAIWCWPDPASPSPTPSPRS